MAIILQNVANVEVLPVPMLPVSSFVIVLSLLLESEGPIDGVRVVG